MDYFLLKCALFGKKEDCDGVWEIFRSNRCLFLCFLIWRVSVVVLLLYLYRFNSTMKHIFAFFIALFLSFSVSAQSPYECRLSIYTEHDGLSQGRVTSLVQDLSLIHI